MNNRIFGPGNESQVEGETFEVKKTDRLGAVSLSTLHDQAVHSEEELVVVVNVNCSVRGQRYSVWHYRPDGWLDPL